MMRLAVLELGEGEAAGLAVERVEAFQVYSPGLPAFPLRAIWARVP